MRQNYWKIMMYNNPILWAMRWSTIQSHLIMKLVSTYKVTKQRRRYERRSYTPCTYEMFVCHIWYDLTSTASPASPSFKSCKKSTPGYDWLWKVFHATSKTLNPVKVEIRLSSPPSKPFKKQLEINMVHPGQTGPFCLHLESSSFHFRSHPGGCASSRFNVDSK